MAYKAEQPETPLQLPGTVLPLVNLAKVTPTDIYLLNSWLSNERIYRWLDMGAGRQSLSILQLQSLMMSPRTYARLASVPGKPAFGLVCLNDAQNLMGTAELWYVRGGHAGEPADVMLSAILSVLASGFFDLQRVVIGAWVTDNNQPSLQIQQRIGMQQIGRQRGRHVIDGQRHDRILFDMTCEEFGQHYPLTTSERGHSYESLGLNLKEGTRDESISF